VNIAQYKLISSVFPVQSHLLKQIALDFEYYRKKHGHNDLYKLAARLKVSRNTLA